MTATAAQQQLKEEESAVWGETWLKEAFADYVCMQTSTRWEDDKLSDERIDQKEFYINTTGGSLFRAFRFVGSLQTEMETIRQRSVSFNLKDAMYGKSHVHHVFWLRQRKDHYHLGFCKAALTICGATRN